jgi:D-tyrosyl-tRNA(Tyr) deacylase
VKILLQRVTQASVRVEGSVLGEIEGGLLVFVGVGHEDLEKVDGGIREPARRGAELLAEKVANLRIFPDADGKSNLSLLDTGGAALVISQFTLYADCRRGRRPSFTAAADPVQAEAVVEEFCSALERLGVPTAVGRFGAHMTVSLVNDGPYTILLDSESLTVPRRQTRTNQSGGDT